MHPDRSSSCEDPERRNQAWFLLLLVAIIGIFFSPVLTNSFVWDDDINIVGNPMIAPVTLEHLQTLWREPYLKLYIPLTYTAWSGLALFTSSFDPETASYVFSPFWFHLVNFILHIVCTLLVYALAGRLVKKGLPAFFAALFFGLHPVQVEAVAWATELKTLLCSLFVFLAALKLLDFQEASAQGKKGAAVFGDYLLSLVFYIAALLSKPIAVVAPFLLLFANHFFLKLKPKDNLLYLAPWAAATVPMALITVLAQPLNNFQQVPPLFERILVAGDTAAFYLWHALLPTGLGIDYGRTPQVVLSSGLAYAAWLLPAGLLALFVYYRKKLSGYLGALLMFLVGFAPVSGIVPFTFQRISTVTDRYLYLALLGPALAVALFFAKPRKRGAIAVFCCILACYGLLCFFQARTWKSRQSLYFHALAVNPKSAMSMFNRAQADTPVTKERVDLIRIAMLHDAKDPKMARELSAILLIYLEGDPMLYVADFVKPDNLPLAEEGVLLGVRLLRERQAQQAVTLLSTAMALRPDYAPAYVNQTAAMLMIGRPKDALTVGEMALLLAPEDPAAANNRAAALFCAGRRHAALKLWEQALSKHPEDPLIARNLALGKRLASTGAGTQCPFFLSIQEPAAAAEPKKAAPQP